jgi:branched-chain amino acid transport system permease protein
MRFLMPLAHRVICLDRGRIIASGAADEIFRDRRVIAAYLGEPAPEH